MNSYQPLMLSFDEAAEIRSHIADSSHCNSLLSESVNSDVADLESYLESAIEIPGQGEAGGYEHNRHKQNYIFLHKAASLWMIKQKESYLSFCIDILKGYADVYPSMNNNVSKDSNPPGRLFHQTLNENMWLLYASLAYSCIYKELSEDDRKHIETNLFRQMIEIFTVDHADDFDIIHNHGLWSVASVGICGYAINDQSVVDMALLGLKGDSISGGFFAQLNELFSPDGYYMEGPYYHRFALRPIILFAEAIESRQPEHNIYQFKDQIIKRTTFALMATAFPDGSLPALNDSSKTISINDEGIVLATSACFQRYSAEANLIAMAHHQQQVCLSKAGLKLALAASHTPATQFNWGSLVLSDGAQGDRGGLGILRHASGEKMDMALLWFGQHGSDHQLHSALDHGHFDGLHLSWFNHGQEVLNDYGFGRWVNVEPKFGGRYIPENKSYCKQTIAHNTVVVDERSQNQGSTAIAEKKWGKLHFLHQLDQHQAISATIDEYYEGVNMQRSAFLLNLSGFDSPVLLDLFALWSDAAHQYDYPIHYQGQITHTNFDYTTHRQLAPLGDSDGYQHLWKVAESDIDHANQSRMLSWLMGNHYYSVHSCTNTDNQLLMCQTGANDPDFNLRNEPAAILRTMGTDVLFANAYEAHGYFNEEFEVSNNARPKISSLSILKHDQNYTAVEISTKDNQWVLLVCNSENHAEAHKLLIDGKSFQWNGRFTLVNDNQ